jgi:Fe-S oxidoreductase
MHITFIKPNIGRQEHSLYVDEARMEPLMLGVLAGLTPPEVDCVLFDDRMETIPYDKATDLVAITVETYTARRAYEIAAKYRARGVPVIMGGMHVNLLPQEVAEHADSIFLGDAETLWPQVIADVGAGLLHSEYRAPVGSAQGGGVLPRRDLYRGKGYLPLSLMQFSRGCRFACHFCAVSEYFGKRHYVRQIDEVLKEISEQERRFLFFVDDNIASDRTALRDLCRALIPMHVHWVSQASLDVTHDEQTMRLMADSGCIGNVMGFESITSESLREAEKSPNLSSFANFREEIGILREYGMQTWAAFTLGLDGDTLASIRVTEEFARRNRFTFGAFNILTPYPGTPLYAKLAAEGRLLYGGKWWLHPEYRFNTAAFKPAQMSAEELTAACHEARVKFNSWWSILYRFSDIQTNLRSLWRAASYWHYTSLFRKEVYKKHGMRFGLR